MSEQKSPEAPVLGGQAVVEGIMIRGLNTLTVTVKAPDSNTITRTEVLSPIFSGSFRRIPFVRGILVLIETLTLGLKALTWSSAVAAGEVKTADEASGLTFLDWIIFLVAFGIGIGVFFAGPVIVTGWLEATLPSWLVLLIEGALRLGLLLAYIWGIGHISDVERMFQFHGAEHMAIAAAESLDRLTPESVMKYSRLHPRCGTSFLLMVGLVSVVVSAFAGSEPLWWRVSSRLLLIPVVAGVAYELIRLADRFQQFRAVRLITAGNLNLQRLTTRPPELEHVEVAIEAVNSALDSEKELQLGKNT